MIKIYITRTDLQGNSKPCTSQQDRRVLTQREKPTQMVCYKDTGHRQAGTPRRDRHCHTGVAVLSDLDGGGMARTLLGLPLILLKLLVIPFGEYLSKSSLL